MQLCREKGPAEEVRIFGFGSVGIGILLPSELRHEVKRV